MKYSFRNDYNQIGSKEILQVLLDNSDSVYVGYGMDEVTNLVTKKVRELVNCDVDVYMLSGGTQTNMIALSKVLNHYEGIICCLSGHINVHETAALEGAGYKLIQVSGLNGKVTKEDVLNVLQKYIDFHMVKPRVVYISNSTEIGTIYTKQELIDLYNVCRENDLYLFLDGARLPVALTSIANDLTLEDVCKYTDYFYLGGTKNGMPYGEMLVIANDEIKKDFLYHLKNKGGMFSKGFVLAHMFLKYLEDDLYLKLATNTNKCAKYLREQIGILGIKEAYVNDTNQIFIELENHIVEELNKDYDFEIWEVDKEKTIIRLVTCFNTTFKSCDSLINDLKKILK